MNFEKTHGNFDVLATNIFDTKIQRHHHINVHSQISCFVLQTPFTKNINIATTNPITINLFMRQFNQKQKNCKPIAINRLQISFTEAPN